MRKKYVRNICFIIIFCTSLIIFSSNICANKKTHRVAFNCYSVPYSFISDDIYYSGMHIDMMNWIAKQKGLDIIYIPYETNGDCLEALRKGAVDLVLGHRTNDSAAAGLQYTAELSTSTLCLFVKNKLASALEEVTDYRLYSVAVEYGTAANAYLANMGVQRYLTQGNQVSTYQALVDEKADMALAVFDSFIYLTHQNDTQDDFTVLRSYISPVSYAILVRPNEKELFNLINAGLTEIRASGNYEKIYKRWEIKDDSVIYAQVIKRIKNIAIGIISVAFIITFLSLALNRILKIKVDEKTKELFDANLELDKKMIQLENESRIRYSMIEFAPSGMVLFDKNYKILLINQAALRLSGQKDEYLDTDIRLLYIFGSIINCIDSDLFVDNDFAKMNERPSVLELGDDSDKRSYRYRIFRLYDDVGVGNILLNVEDITVEELEKLELIEKEKNKSLNRLIAGIAHEIKNPLMALRTAASLIREKREDPEVQEAFAKFVPDEVDRMNQLIESLINYARPFKGMNEMISLADVVRDCLYLVNLATKKDRINFEIVLDDTVVVFANRDSIKQSVINIMMNSIESMVKKQQGSLNDLLTMEISVNKDDKYSYLHIKDEGVGMSQTDIYHCTEPFYTTKQAGTGLGLALVHQFISKNNGILEIKSEQGSYTEVTLKFRRADTNETKNIDN